MMVTSRAVDVGPTIAGFTLGGRRALALNPDDRTAPAHTTPAGRSRHSAAGIVHPVPPRSIVWLMTGG
jgi:hypothetical protein